ncbi:MFS transporter [Gluconacetobacter azotocaptans]|uniref:MFS transporter n=1 Tax=Gluconacetobacter azotocaptans TaxID=142834 RepID=A0A7W4PBT4_9PROT|nr:MFS transporter [Gluconacetobacter azotocaptans]MBB2188487.1 MFS transporter [Gluconacetobacter azotocaptans]GBQ27972.1 sugar transporter transmembrane protein [Gluconacetobacter azotocaptans DSM 13594]
MTSGSHGAQGRRYVLTAVIGNVVEYYDLVIYSYFSASIARIFFPSHLSFSQIGLALATFGFTLLARPVGAYVLGGYADRKGRLPGLTACMALMAAGGVLIALCPDYESIGYAAPCLIVFARLLQGFSLGGEFGVATSFLIEHAPHHEAKRASWQAVGQISASLCACCVVLTLSGLMTSDAYAAYGFRIAAMLGSLGGLVGLALRYSLGRRDHLPVARPSPAEERTWLRILLVMGMVSLGSGITYLGFYMPHYAQSVFHVSVRATYWAAFATYAGQLVLTPLRWRLAAYFDRTKRIYPMLLSCLGLMILPVLLVEWVPWTPALVLCAPLVLNVLGLFYFASLDGYMGLLFGSAHRGRGLSVGYSLGVALFGGMAPMLNGAVINLTGLQGVPGYYVLATALLAAISVGMGRRFLKKDVASSVDADRSAI